MVTNVNPKERFRKAFVVALTLANTVAFLAMLSGFFEALLLAAIFSGLTYPLYLWLLQRLGGRRTSASLLTLVITLFAMLIPLLFLLALVAEQAIDVAREAKPWIEQQLAQSESQATGLPDWVPFADRLEPYRDEIMAKLGEFASASGTFLAGGLAQLSEGTFVFFFQLFIMLYAMFFFLMDGPALMKHIMNYAPLSQADRQKMIDVALSVSRATIKGALLIGAIQGTLAGIGFAVVGIEAAVFWGAIMAVLSILPGIGAPLVWVPAVIYLFMSGQVVAGIGLLIWSAGVVGSIDNFLRPVLVGRDTKMPDLLILLSTLGGIALFGASGLVLGPILAALFLTVLAIYSKVFADWLNVDQSPADPPSQSAGVQPEETA
ncbi:MAG: AI-2E family transporter [Sedimenticolaceae bacterium]